MKSHSSFLDSRESGVLVRIEYAGSESEFNLHIRQILHSGSKRYMENVRIYLYIDLYSFLKDYSSS